MRSFPDALVFALLLSLAVFAAVLGLTAMSASEALLAWSQALWSLNAFAFQMCLVLFLGQLLALSPPVSHVLVRGTQLVPSATWAPPLLTLLSLVACYLNWGLGLMVAATAALHLAQRFPTLSPGVLLASGYAGFLIWHAGPSGSIPLSIAGDDKVLRDLALSPIPLSQTLFAPATLQLVLLLSLALVLTSYVIARQQRSRTTESFTLAPSSEEAVIHESFGSRLLLKGLGAALLTGLVMSLKKQNSFDINHANLLFLALNAFAWPGIQTLLRVLPRSAQNLGPLLLQYPLYAALMGLMQASGLGDVLTRTFQSWASAESFPLWSFLSAGVLNFIIPSGGGQWVIQGPILMKSALALGVDPARTAMAIAWGDAWTNMIQPFWALPLLTLTRRPLSELMVPALVYLLVSGVVLALGLRFL